MIQPSTKRQCTATDDVPESNTKPDYLKVPDHIFKKMLSSALEGIESTIQWLDTPEKLQYTRQYAQWVNDLFYLRLKQDFWEHYYHIAMTNGLWSLNISNQFAKENSLRRMKFITQSNVNQRRQTVSEELKEAEKKLNTHKQLASNATVDMHRLSMVIPAFVRRGQRKLVADFERRKLLLQLDANDYYLVQAFYDLKPTEEQVRIFLLISR